MAFTKITLAPGGRMIRIGFGQHDFKWYARIDLWYWGFRVAQK